MQIVSDSSSSDADRARFKSTEETRTGSGDVEAYAWTKRHSVAGLPSTGSGGRQDAGPLNGTERLGILPETDRAETREGVRSESLSSRDSARKRHSWHSSRHRQPDSPQP